MSKVLCEAAASYNLTAANIFVGIFSSCDVQPSILRLGRVRSTGDHFSRASSQSSRQTKKRSSTASPNLPWQCLSLLLTDDLDGDTCSGASVSQYHITSSEYTYPHE